jgi:spermidine synthase
MLSWGIESTVVELVPSIPGLLGFYHTDGDALRASPLARIVVDDARRFLERTRASYDVIVVDPPPPVEAAGSSLLYSAEFLNAVRTRLAPGGILQHWLPWGDATILASVTRALTESFVHVRVFKSLEGWGWHFLASGTPIPIKDSTALAARLPDAAVADLLEWGPHTTVSEMFEEILVRELPLDQLLSLSPVPALTDDRPWNEYYLLRRRGSSAPLLR